MTVPNGYMTLKVELAATKIVRTIVVPEHMTLEDLHDAIQAVMGWEDAHLWHFTDRRRDGVIYELPHEDDGFPSFLKRLTIDASKMTLRKVLPNRGAKLYCEYDFGDGWQHVVTRQADPRRPGSHVLRRVAQTGSRIRTKGSITKQLLMTAFLSNRSIYTSSVCSTPAM